MVLALVGFDLPVPLLQDINKKSELFVFLMQFVGVKLMKLELRIVFGPKKALNILLERVTIVECHYILQGCAHVSIQNIQNFLLFPLPTPSHQKPQLRKNAFPRYQVSIRREQQIMALMGSSYLFYNSPQKMEHSNNNIPEVFLFVNSTSGGGIGRELLDLNVKQLNLQVSASQYPIDRDNKVKVTLNIFDMSQTENREEGFTLLKSTVSSQKKVILIICGGDGTVMWVVSELHNFDIDHTKVPVAMLPLGTGNDFSQILGWGKECPSDLLSEDFAKLKKRVSYWLSARQQFLDVWMVEASAQEYGKLQKVTKQSNTLIEGKSITRHFCNYFSVGVDGKIGYSFDLHRTQSRLGNLVVYGAMGLIKSFTKTKTVGQLTRELKELPPSEIKEADIDIKVKSAERQLDTRQIVILAEGKEEMEEIKDNENILFMNINSFMGGVRDVWKNAKTPPNLKEYPFNPESYSDGKLEVLSFGGAWSLGFEKSVGGFATKVHQGTGPFSLQFNKFPEEEKHRTYLQIDGQFIRYTHPKNLLVKKSNLSKTGQMRILKRVPLEVQRRCCC